MLVFDVKNLGWNCKIHEHQPTERIPETVMLQYTSAVESGDSVSEPFHLPLVFGRPSPALKAMNGWGYRQGVPKYVRMSSNESLHHCVCMCAATYLCSGIRE